MKTAIIDVGGGYRGIFGAGVLDACQDFDLAFDVAIGVSAGAANLSSFLAHQRGRNRTFYLEYGFRKAYASLGNFLRTRCYADLDYIYSTLSNSDGENPLDYDALSSNPAAFVCVAADALTGETVYFDKRCLTRDSYDILKATAAVPVFSRPYPINGRPYFDGGISDPIPLRHALDLGCDRVVLILTRPVDQLRSPDRDAVFARVLAQRYPKAAALLKARSVTYNDGVAFARTLQQQGKVLILAPEDIHGLGTFTRDRGKLEALYEEGVRCAQRIPGFLRGADLT